VAEVCAAKQDAAAATAAAAAVEPGKVPKEVILTLQFRSEICHTVCQFCVQGGARWGSSSSSRSSCSGGVQNQGEQVNIQRKAWLCCLNHAIGCVAWTMRSAVLPGPCDEGWQVKCTRGTRSAASTTRATEDHMRATKGTI